MENKQNRKENKLKIINGGKYSETIMLQIRCPTPATPPEWTCGVTCTTLTPFVSYSHPNTARSLRLAFSHRALTLRRSLTHRSRAVMRPTCAARSFAPPIAHPTCTSLLGLAVRRAAHSLL
jgi:hypothetical protein